MVFAAHAGPSSRLGGSVLDLSGKQPSRCSAGCASVGQTVKALETNEEKEVDDEVHD